MWKKWKKKRLIIALCLIISLITIMVIPGQEIYAVTPLTAEVIPYVLTALVAGGLVISNSEGYQEAAKSFWFTVSDDVRNLILMQIGTGYVVMRGIWSTVRDSLNNIKDEISSQGYYSWVGNDGYLISLGSTGQQVVWPNGQGNIVGKPYKAGFSYGDTPRSANGIVMFVDSSLTGIVGYDMKWGIMWNGSWYSGPPEITSGSFEVVDDYTFVLRDNTGAEIYRRTFTTKVRDFSGLRVSSIDDRLPIVANFEWAISGSLNSDQVSFSDVLSNPNWNLEERKVAVPSWTESEWIGKTAYDLSTELTDIPAGANEEIGTVKGWLSEVWNSIRTLPEAISNSISNVLERLFKPTISLQERITEVKDLAMTKLPFTWVSGFFNASNPQYGSQSIVFDWPIGLNGEIASMQIDSSPFRDFSRVVIIAVALIVGYLEVRRWIG